MAFDYRKLKGRIIEKYDSQRMFAEAMGLSTRSLSLKMTGKRAWKQEEIVKAYKILDIPASEISAYFFTLKVKSS